MIIEFNDTSQLKTTLIKVDSIPDLYQLTLEKIDLVKSVAYPTEYFFTMNELKQFVSHLNKATCDYI
jgi:hypothetical protein